MDESAADVRSSAINTLDFTQSPQVLTVLMRLTASPDGELKKAAILALGRCKSIEALPKLIPLIESSERGVKTDADWAIHNITGKSFASASAAQQWFESEKKNGAENVKVLLDQLK